MLRLGTIKEVEDKKAKVEIGTITTEWLPWLVRRAGSNSKTTWTPEVGEQVIVFSPDGELGQGIIGGSIFQSETAGFEDDGSDDEVDRTKVGDALFELSHDSVTLKAKSGGAVNLGNNPTEFAAIASKVEQNDTTIRTTYDSHLHPTPFGPTGVPAVLFGAPAASVAATEVKVK